MLATTLRPRSDGTLMYTPIPEALGGIILGAVASAIRGFPFFLQYLKKRQDVRAAKLAIEQGHVEIEKTGSAQLSRVIDQLIENQKESKLTAKENRARITDLETSRNHERSILNELLGIVSVIQSHMHLIHMTAVKLLIGKGMTVVEIERDLPKPISDPRLDRILAMYEEIGKAGELDGKSL